MNIYLLGYMGCGKTSIARQLAHFSNRQFVDLDDSFETTHGNIGEFFRQHGEAAFRTEETAILHQSEQWDNCIIALGGGTPCFGNNMDWLLQHGFTVYLKMNESTLLQRLSNAQKKRPLLETLSAAEMRHFIGKQLMQRTPFYERAHLIYPGINVKAADLWQQIEVGMSTCPWKDTDRCHTRKPPQKMGQTIR